MKHLTTFRLKNPFTYVATLLLFRGAVHGIVQAACWLFIAIPVLGFTDDLYIIFANTAVLGLSWSEVTFGAAISNASSLYSAHTIMLMDVILTFFSGVFFLMSRSYPFFEALHDINPLFYVLSANSYIITSKMDNRCGVLNHPGECASGSRIVELDESAECSSLTAQACNCLFVLVAFCWHVLSLELVIASPTSIFNYRHLKPKLDDVTHEKSMRKSMGMDSITPLGRYPSEESREGSLDEASVWLGILDCSSKVSTIAKLFLEEFSEYFFMLC